MPESSVYTILKKASVDFNDQPAIIEPQQVTSFKELYNQSENLRENLTASCGKENSVVAIIYPNGKNFLKAMFAVVGSGCIVLPVYAGLKHTERQNIYKTAGVNYVLGEKRMLRDEASLNQTIFESGSEILIKLDSNIGIMDTFIAPAMIRFSSGTTGKSKGVVLSHKSVLERTEAVSSILKLKSGDRVLWVLPMAFHFIATLVSYIRNGVTLISCPSFLSEDILKLANQHEASHLYAAPLHVKLLANDVSGIQFRTLSSVISTSSGIDKTSCKNFEKKYGIPVFQAYGIIEVGIPLLNEDSNHFEKVGKAGNYYDAAILDDHGETLGVDELGQLGLKGRGMFDGYLNPYSSVNENLKNGWFLTGDLAIQYDDGSIEIKGRMKSVINVAGNKVFPEEVERSLEALIEVKSAYVYGKEHKLTGEMVVADVVLDDVKPIDSDKIISMLQPILASFKIPKYINFVESHKYTATGKKQRT